MFMIFQTLISLSLAQSLPAPADSLHPGSKVYSYGFAQSKTNCLNRNVDILQPTPSGSVSEKFPVIVFGHGQALDLAHYQMTFEHLAKKGVIVLFPKYDNGFFDQDWVRMASDYVKQTDCALKTLPNADSTAIIFSGHSKGAYVASLAAGMVDSSVNYQLRANVFFAPAGSDNKLLKAYSADTSTTVVYSDADTIVDKGISENIFMNANSKLRQLITLKSYPNTSLKADHFWILTKSSFVGGKNGDNALHYYGAWKWLVAAAWDLRDGAKSLQPYLYGDLVTDKGVDGLFDDILRN
jgi:dienelactone hydrolase